MDLPRALEPWRPYLALFPRDLALALGGLVDNLSLLVGPMLSPDGAGRGEPDGVGGIGRRGSFERLLATEWALAEEAPLEFLRRVSSGELSFLEMAHQRPTVARQSIVLFDVGPDQRGAPRVVHLAVLILLAKRAREAGASFSWGLLQEGTLFSDVNEESVRLLVQASLPPGTIAADAEWLRHRFAEMSAEVWIVGGPSITDVSRDLDVFRIRIDDSDDPGAPSDLFVQVFTGKPTPRSVRLELPPSPLCIRLLRDPFQVAKAAPKKSTKTIHYSSNLVFSSTGKQVFVLGAGGELLTIPVPKSPNARETPKPRAFFAPSGETIMSVGTLRHTNRIAVVTLAENALIVHALSKRGGSSMSHERYNLVREHGLRTMDEQKQLGTLYTTDEEGHFFHDGYDSLFRLARKELVATSFSGAIPSVYQDGSTLIWYSEQGDKHFLVRCSKAGTQAQNLFGTPVEIERVIAGAQSIVVWFGKGRADFISNDNCLPLLLVDFEPDGEVIGGTMGREAGILVLDSSCTKVKFVGKDRAETWFTTQTRIRTVTVLPGCWLIGFITEANELCVYSRDYKAIVLRLQMGAP